MGKTHALNISTIRKCAMLAALLVCLTAAVVLSMAMEKTDRAVLTEKTVIVVDPGHGGVDGGTGDEALLEKNINLAIALKLRALLEQRGYAVFLTRDRDVSPDGLNSSSSRSGTPPCKEATIF